MLVLAVIASWMEEMKEIKFFTISVIREIQYLHCLCKQRVSF